MRLSIYCLMEVTEIDAEVFAPFKRLLAFLTQRKTGKLNKSLALHNIRVALRH